MNTVKIYVICINDEEYRFSRSQCEYIQCGDGNRRKGGHLNVKYIMSNSYKEGYKKVLEMIKHNNIMDHGVILFGNDRLHREFWDMVYTIVSTLNKKDLCIYFNYYNIDNSKNVSENPFTLLSQSTFSNFSQSFENFMEHPKSCIVSRSFLQKDRDSEDQLIECKNTKPPFSIIETDEISCYNNVTSLCYFPKRQESLFNKLFDGVYCINLTTRNDRLVNFQKRMEKHNIKFERFNAVSKSFLSSLANISMPLIEGEKRIKMNNAGLLGCLLSHLNVMKTALSRNEKQILIFEDDASVHKDANVLLLNFVQSLEKMSINIRDVDCIHFGYVPVIQKGDYKNPDVWSYRFLEHLKNNRNVLKSKHFLCNHAYAVNEKFMKAFIELYSQSQEHFGERISPNDWAIRNLFLENPDFKCFAPCPQIFGVKPFVSDNSDFIEDENDVEARATNSNYTYFDDYE